MHWIEQATSYLFKIKGEARWIANIILIKSSVELRGTKELVLVQTTPAFSCSY